MGTLAYIKNFITDRDVASITPSSKFLVKRVCRWIDFSEPSTVVEYGPGTGVFSDYLLEHLPAGSTLVLIEGNANFVDALREKWGDDPRTVITCDRAENVSDILDDHEIEDADYVLSGIPFSFLGDDTAMDLIHQTQDVLRDDGKFLVYQVRNYMEEPLRKSFPTVTKKYHLLNVPPMFCYEALMQPNGHAAGRPATNGHAANSHAANGSAANGHSANGTANRAA